MTFAEAVTAVASMKSVYPRLYKLARAIEEFEGPAPGSRAHRNNNPGNLRSSVYATLEPAGGYAAFSNYFEGFFGLLFDLWCKCTARTGTGLGPASTLAELMRVYAPAGDHNDPDNYGHFVSVRVGAGLGTPISWFLGD